jgi:hypothetical protein
LLLEDYHSSGRLAVDVLPQTNVEVLDRKYWCRPLSDSVVFSVFVRILAALHANWYQWNSVPDDSYVTKM